ncbi:MBL fold metallo-hydrolase [Streptacidiphilus sp. EB129]|uniref:MBL fold metallo-hydrolase n=1 Tax=Streptacidiphilus sp. EB129 TaxID=3156262 RepID=UPI0035125876
MADSGGGSGGAGGSGEVGDATEGTAEGSGTAEGGDQTEGGGAAGAGGRAEGGGTAGGGGRVGSGGAAEGGGTAGAGGAAGGGVGVGGRDADGTASELRVEVFTGPESAFFSTSALVYGPTEALLVDTQLTRSAGRELAEWVAGKARRLTAVLITHPHPDHYFGTEEILRLFPGTPVYAVLEVIDVILTTGLDQVALWRPVFGDDVTSRPVVPGPLPGDRLRVDGVGLGVLSMGQGDCAASSVLHVPGADTVIAGDLVYNGTHVWTAETTPQQRTDWRANLVRLRALGATRVIAGHRAPGQDDDARRVLDFTAGYLREFDEQLARHPDDAAALVAAVNETYAELTLPWLLERGAEANTARHRAGKAAEAPSGGSSEPRSD